MSFHGQSPKVKRVRFTPQSTDPVNPQEGDFFYADGTSRTEGLYVYANSAWAVVSSAAANTFDSLVLTPQSSDPGTPTEGEVFLSDGTSRTEGVWLYDGSDWVQLTGQRQQEYEFKDIVEVRVASTANVTLASGVENGDTLDGVVLATNDLVLLPHQNTATENGVYVVQASGAPVRHSSADTAAELNDYVAFVTEGTINARTIWYQTATISNLAADNQVWAATPADKSFEVPAGVHSLRVFGVGAGGGGGGGGGRDTTGAGGGGSGGGGGGGGRYGLVELEVTPGETLTVTLGAYGPGGAGGTQNSNVTITAGTTGGTTYIKRSSTTLASWIGGGGGGKGATGAGNAGTAGADTDVAAGGALGAASGSYNGGGGGGGGGLAGRASGGAGGSGAAGDGGDATWTSGGGGGSAAVASLSGAGGAGGNSDFAAGGAGGTNAGVTGADAGAGGGGGASWGAGGAGGNVANGAGSNPGANGAYGGGGGGGAGSTNSPSNGGNGGHGGKSYLRLSW